MKGKLKLKSHTPILYVAQVIIISNVPVRLKHYKIASRQTDLSDKNNITPLKKGKIKKEIKEMEF